MNKKEPLPPIFDNVYLYAIIISFIIIVGGQILIHI